MVNGTAIRDLSSCSSGESPKAPGGSNDAWLKEHLENGIAQHEQIAAEIERASEPDGDAVSSQDETSALSSETPGR